MTRRGAKGRPPAAKTVQPRMDNMDDVRTAHDIRRLVQCAHCRGIGDRAQMIVGPESGAGTALHHTRCFIERYGFNAVLELPKAELGKFRLCDMTRAQARRLLDA